MSTTITCQTIINLSTPSGSVRERGFQPPWHTVYLYTCPGCSAQHRIRANSFRGSRPEPGTGGIVCGRMIDERRN